MGALVRFWQGRAGHRVAAAADRRKRMSVERRLDGPTRPLKATTTCGVSLIAVSWRVRNGRRESRAVGISRASRPPRFGAMTPTEGPTNETASVDNGRDDSQVADKGR